jgi:hypothetical protein
MYYLEMAKILPVARILQAVPELGRFQAAREQYNRNADIE